MASKYNKLQLSQQSLLQQ